MGQILTNLGLFCEHQVAETHLIISQTIWTSVWKFWLHTELKANHYSLCAFKRRQFSIIPRRQLSQVFGEYLEIINVINIMTKYDIST